jgi:transcriptional regulator with XRE-family HTH domain
MLMATTASTLDLQGIWLAMQSNDDDFCKALGQRIAHLRKDRGLTQVQLAAQLGIAQQTLSHYEGGNLRVPLALLPRLGEIFEMSLDELLTGHPASRQPGKRGPVSRLQQQLTAISTLPKAQQNAVSVFLDALFAQHGGHAQIAPNNERQAG